MTGLVAVGASYIVTKDIIDILIDSYALSVSGLLVPLLFAYFSTNLKKRAAILASVPDFLDSSFSDGSLLAYRKNWPHLRFHSWHI